MAEGANSPRGNDKSSAGSGPWGTSRRLIPLFIVLGAAVTAVLVLMDHAAAVAELDKRFEEEARLRMASTAEHVEDYFDAIYSTLYYISLDNHIRDLDRDSEGAIQKIYEYQWQRHQLTEVYVIERAFTGRQPPFMTFEREEREGDPRLHELNREIDEYHTQVAQIARFAERPGLQALVSSEIPLCADDASGGRARGLVYSVPIRSTKGLVGIVAGMVKTDSILEKLDKDRSPEAACMVNERGDLYFGQDVADGLRGWLRQQFARERATDFFAASPPRREVEGWNVLWTPLKVVSGQGWWLMSFYQADPESMSSSVFGAWWHEALAGSLTLAGGAPPLWVRGMQRRQREQRRYEAERQRLEREVQQASQREQRRIGEHLQEDLCQRLAGLAAVCKVLEKKLSTLDPAASALATELATEVNESLARARQLADALHPVTFEAEGLQAALEELARKTEKTGGIECQVEGSGSKQLHDSELATHLYRVAQEAVSNVLRHARAKRLTIGLVIDPAEGRLRVEDDGVGVGGPADAWSGMGLRMMRYRSELLGGMLEVRRGAECGTLVECRMPFAVPGGKN